MRQEWSRTARGPPGASGGPWRTPLRPPRSAAGRLAPRAGLLGRHRAQRPRERPRPADGRDGVVAGGQHLPPGGLLGLRLRLDRRGVDPGVPATMEGYTTRPAGGRRDSLRGRRVRCVAGRLSKPVHRARRRSRCCWSHPSRWPSPRPGLDRTRDPGAHHLFTRRTSGRREPDRPGETIVRLRGPGDLGERGGEGGRGPRPPRPWGRQDRRREGGHGRPAAREALAPDAALHLLRGAAGG